MQFVSITMLKDILPKRVMDQVEKILEGDDEYERNEAGIYVPSEVEETADDIYVENKRLSSDAKAAITREVKEYMADKEKQIKKYTKELGEITPSKSPNYSEGKQDVVFHRSDDHFGDVVKDSSGKVIYNTEICTDQIEQYFNKALTYIDEHDKDVENAYLLLGGDIVTNEAIYDGQAHDIEATIDKQIEAATGAYMNAINTLSEEFDHVKVVAQGGNHGEFRVKGSSNHANADDLLYNELHNIVKWSGIDNVSFVMSDRSDHVNFDMRGHKGHLRHGDNVNNHIGTSSPESTWRAFLNRYEFDIAYRGHYHEKKMEDVQGRPVMMAPSQKPAGDFEGTIGAFGRPGGYFHFVSDEEPLEEIKLVYHDDK